MSWLSKGAKTVAAVAAPLTTIPLKVGSDLLAGKNPIKGLTDFGATPGVPNPFGVPDLSFLNNPTDLTSKFKPIDTSKTDATFNDLLTNIGGQNQNDTDKLNGLLQDIGIDENHTVGSTKMDFADRGLGGPGQISDIEASALAQNRADADRTRSNARVATVGAGLDRTAKAYSDKFSADADTAKTDAGIKSDLLKTGSSITADQQNKLAQLLVDLYSGGAKNNVDTQQPGFLDSILRNIQINVPVGGK